MIEIYTDGSCRGNGQENSNGGFGVAAIENEKIIYMSSQDAMPTTNNREELKAIIHALELTQTEYKDKKCIIYSDSAYCVNMCNDWIWNWYHKGWVRTGNKPIENLDLVKQIYQYLIIEFNNFEIIKVKGHNGNLGNEIADALATFDKAKLAKIFEEHKEKFVKEIKIDF